MTSAASPLRINIAKTGFGKSTATFDPVELGIDVFSMDSFFAAEPAPVDIVLPALIEREANKINMRVAVAKGKIFKELWRQRLQKADHHTVYVAQDDVGLSQGLFWPQRQGGPGQPSRLIPTQGHGPDRRGQPLSQDHLPERAGHPAPWAAG